MVSAQDQIYERGLNVKKNNDLQNITQKIQDWATRTPLKTGNELMFSGSASLVTPVVLLLNDTNIIWYSINLEVNNNKQHMTLPVNMNKSSNKLQKTSVALVVNKFLATNIPRFDH
jgi:hypothetical protein